jgi:hypothetical protein
MSGALGSRLTKPDANFEQLPLLISDVLYTNRTINNMPEIFAKEVDDLSPGCFAEWK